jgi:hypothetical protein
MFSVALQERDHLVLDNVAWTVLNPPRHAKVLVVTNGNPVLNAVFGTDDLKSRATVQFEPLTYLDRNWETDPEVQQFDLVVFDRCAPASMPACNTVFWRSRPPGVEGALEDAPAPVVLNWNSLHPLTRLLSLGDLEVVEAQLAEELPKGGTALVESDRGPLVYALTRGPYTDVVHSFALVDDDGSWKTNWPLKPSFPLYIVALVEQLGQGTSGEEQSLQPGDPIEIQPQVAVDDATMELPDGRTIKLKPNPSGKFEFLETELLGVYTLTAGEETVRRAVNLFDALESNIAPASQVQIGVEATNSERSLIQTRWELWHPLAIIAFFFLLIEWHIFNRRVHL